MTLPLEQLVAEYLDHKLTAKEEAQVKVLLQENIQAKEIHDEILALRRAIRSLPEPQLPHQFQDDLLKNIAANSPKIAEKRSVIQPERFSWKKRLSNPRLWLYPTVVLLVAFVLSTVERWGQILHHSEKIATNFKHDSGVNNSGVLETDSPFVPPMSEGSDVPKTEKNERFSQNSTLVISCQFSEEALKQKYMHRILAENDISSVVKTNGITSDVTYEMEVTPIQLVTLLDLMRADEDSVVELSIPSTLSALFERSPTASSSLFEASEMIKVRFVIKNAQ